MTYRHPDAVIQIFARAPVPGAVKTRLIPALGAEGAAALQAKLLFRTLEMATRASMAPVQLWCAPDCRHAAFQDWPGVSRHVQQGADLGERMAHALAAGLRSAQRVVLIGTDCPALDANGLHQAIARLADHDVVLGPAEDGGYVLVGWRRPVALFAGIDWGSEQVLDQTRARLRAAGASWHELPVLWDVDRPADVARLARFQNS